MKRCAVTKLKLATREPQGSSRLSERYAYTRQEVIGNTYLQWRILGEHFADLLADPTTPEALRDALAEEIMQLANQTSGILIPEILRFAYPILRDQVKRTKHD